MITIFFGIYLILTDTQALPRQAREAAPMPDEILANFARKPDDKPVVITESTDPEGMEILACAATFQRKASNRDQTVSFDYYPAGGDARGAPLPAVIVSPITGGNYELERVIARDLQSHGYHAVLMKRPPRAQFAAALESFEAFEESMRDTVASGLRVVDWLSSRPEVDAKRIGAYGVSLGGMLTVLLAAADSRIVASVAIMAGGDFPAVLARSVEPEARRFSAANGLPRDPSPEDLADFESRARATMTTDPLAFASHVDPRTIFLVNTRRDTSVPSFLQVALRMALGSPETLSLPTGHYAVSIYLPMVMDKARAFLDRKLGAP